LATIGSGGIQAYGKRSTVFLVQKARISQGRNPQSSAGIIDSQSVKTSEGGEERGVDVHKQTPGRKRHVIVDTLGLLLFVLVHRASMPDGNGGKLVLAGLFQRIKHSIYNRWCRLKLIWADGAYEDIIAWVKQQFGWRLEIVRRPPDAKGFQILPRRWAVERTFGWLGRYHRLGRDYEHQTLSSESMVYLASIHRMVRLLSCKLIFTLQADQSTYQNSKPQFDKIRINHIIILLFFYKKTLSPISVGLAEMPTGKSRIFEHIFSACSSSQ
jgi:putative transposase